MANTCLRQLLGIANLSRGVGMPEAEAFWRDIARHSDMSNVVEAILWNCFQILSSILLSTYKLTIKMFSSVEKKKINRFLWFVHHFRIKNTGSQNMTKVNNNMLEKMFLSCTNYLEVFKRKHIKQVRNKTEREKNMEHNTQNKNQMLTKWITCICKVNSTPIE